MTESQLPPKSNHFLFGQGVKINALTNFIKIPS